MKRTGKLIRYGRSFDQTLRELGIEFEVIPAIGADCAYKYVSRKTGKTVIATETVTVSSAGDDFVSEVIMTEQR